MFCEEGRCLGSFVARFWCWYSCLLLTSRWVGPVLNAWPVHCISYVCCLLLCGLWGCSKLLGLFCRNGLLSDWKNLIQLSLSKYFAFGQLQPLASPVLRRCWESECGCAAAVWKVTFGLFFSAGMIIAWNQWGWIYIYALCLREPVLVAL